MGRCCSIGNTSSMLITLALCSVRPMDVALPLMKQMAVLMPTLLTMWATMWTVELDNTTSVALMVVRGSWALPGHALNVRLLSTMRAREAGAEVNRHTTSTTAARTRRVMAANVRVGREAASEREMQVNSAEHEMSSTS